MGGVGARATVRGGYLRGLFTGYSVSVSRQFICTSLANLRSEVTQTPGWLTGASSEASLGPGLRNFTSRDQPRGPGTPASLQVLCQRVGGDAPGDASAAGQ